MTIYDLYRDIIIRTIDLCTMERLCERLGLDDALYRCFGRNSDVSELLEEHHRYSQMQHIVQRMDDKFDIDQKFERIVKQMYDLFRERLHILPDRILFCLRIR